MIDEELSKSVTEALSKGLGNQAETVERDLNDFYCWMLNKGKNPDRAKGLSESQADNYHSRIDQIYRFVLFRLTPTDRRYLTHGCADAIIEKLDDDAICTQAGEPYAETSKRKFSNALEKYFEWRHDDCGDMEEWTPQVSFSDGRYNSADKLNFEERWKVRQAALDHGSLPNYYETTQDERDRISGIVAQRVGKPKEEITRKDWEKADSGSKIGSLVSVALETGIIPCEVNEARLGWYDPKRNVFRIPNEYAGKNRPTKDLPLTEEAGENMSKWIQERRHLRMYDGTNRLWLNNEGNPYDSANLCDLVRRLCDQVGIDYENRKIVWYSLRHNLGQSIEEEEDLSEARDQLRHESIETTKKFYGESPIESRRQTLEQINTVARKAAENPDFNPYADNEREHVSVSSKAATSRSPPEETAHIDSRIKDTQEARNEFARKVMNDEV